MNFNTRMELLKQNIVQLIGESELPVGVIYYILKDLFEDITNAYNQSLVLEKSLSEEKENNPSNEQEQENKEDVEEEYQEN